VEDRVIDFGDGASVLGVLVDLTEEVERFVDLRVILNRDDGAGEALN
jgi:hypothetical protein